jgi:hypothetical protein
MRILIAAALLWAPMAAQTPPANDWTLDCGGRLVLTLDGERSAPTRYAVPMTQEEVHAVRGDRPISSGTPAMRKLNPSVVGILFQFPRPDSKKCE